MKVFDFRSDFRYGRTGGALRIRQDTKAYHASVRDADNMMVTQEGQLYRRWGTLLRTKLTGTEARARDWAYGLGDTLNFILIFTDSTLTIYDLTFTVRATFTGENWTSETLRYMTMVQTGSTMIVADATFQPRVIEFDGAAGTFSIRDWNFKISGDLSAQKAPFFAFSDDYVATALSFFTSSGTSTGYATLLEQAMNITDGSFNGDGTGHIKTDADLFVAGHVGTRMQILDGEVEITAVTDARNADVTIRRDVARLLDANPFYIHKGSTIVDVPVESHGLKAGDIVFFAGLADDEAAALLDYAPLYATDASTATTKNGTGAAYVVKRVIDNNLFQIDASVIAVQNGTFAAPNWGTGSSSTFTLPTNDILAGGQSVMMFVIKGIGKVSEPIFSPVRGWPQAMVMHERRLWLGGSEQLPDAMFGSQFGQIENFDPGDGGDSDAVLAYGIGQRSRVRAMTSAFDLQVFTSNGEFYVPGSRDAPITQTTIRVVQGTAFGCAYTPPQVFDGATYFLDGPGLNLRAYEVASRNQDYTADAVSIVIPDWIKQQKDTCLFGGSPLEITPYMILSGGTDGAAIVMHSSKANDALGFMRWTLENGSFQSFCGLNNQLFAVAERNGQLWLIEFDTSVDHTTCDFATHLTADTATTSWTDTDHANETVQCESLRKVYTPFAVAADGTFSTPEAVTDLYIGDAMPWSVVMNPAIIGNGQGTMIGKDQCLVSTEISWISTWAGTVEDMAALDALDAPALEAPTPVDEFREYHIGKWGREPTLTISGDVPGHVGIRGLVMNVYV